MWGSMLNHAPPARVPDGDVDAALAARTTARAAGRPESHERGAQIYSTTTLRQDPLHSRPF